MRVGAFMQVYISVLELSSRPGEAFCLNISSLHNELAIDFPFMQTLHASADIWLEEIAPHPKRSDYHKIKSQYFRGQKVHFLWLLSHRVLKVSRRLTAVEVIGF